MRIVLLSHDKKADTAYFRIESAMPVSDTGGFVSIGEGIVVRRDPENAHKAIAIVSHYVQFLRRVRAGGPFFADVAEERKLSPVFIALIKWAAGMVRASQET